MDIQELTKQAQIGNGCIVDKEVRKMHPELNAHELYAEFANIVRHNALHPNEVDGKGNPVAQLGSAMRDDMTTRQTTISLRDGANPNSLTGKPFELVSMTIDMDTKKILKSDCNSSGYRSY